MQFKIGETVRISPVIPGLEDIADKQAVVEQLLPKLLMYIVKVGKESLKIHECELKKI